MQNAKTARPSLSLDAKTIYEICSQLFDQSRADYLDDDKVLVDVLYDDALDAFTEDEVPQSETGRFKELIEAWARYKEADLWVNG